MSSIIKLKRGTTSSWDRENPVLAAGEPGVDISINPPTLKIGDGKAPWSSLQPINKNNPFQVVGHFTNYTQPDIRRDSDGWRVLIRQITETSVCVRLENEYFKGRPSSRVLYLTLENGETYYSLQFTNSSSRGFFLYSLQGSSTPLDAGNTDWYFDSTNGFFEVDLDTTKVAEIFRYKEFTISSAVLMNNSVNPWSDLAVTEQIYFHLDESIVTASVIGKYTTYTFDDLRYNG